jgi:NAD(P)-dependent dehydrogenase (short-subunit alcohol dehydrogenase family)
VDAGHVEQSQLIFRRAGQTAIPAAASGAAWARGEDDAAARVEGTKYKPEAGRHDEDTSMERPAQSDEIAPAFVFIASEGDSSYITGEVVTLLGGETTAG